MNLQKFCFSLITLIMFLPALSFSQLDPIVQKDIDQYLIEQIGVSIINSTPSNANHRDEDDLLLATRGDQFIDDFWEKADSSEYTYNSENLVTEILFKGYDGTLWNTSSRWTYEYDSNGERTVFLRQNWNGTDWENVSKSTYEYDANGNQTLWTLVDWDNGDWDNTLQFVYEFDSNNNRITSTLYTDLGMGWEIGNRFVFEYIDNLLDIALLENWNGTSWEDVFRQTYEYDTNSFLTSRLREDWEMTEWVNNSLNSYERNSNGDITVALYKVWNNGVWGNVSQEIFNYDSAFNAILVIGQYWDETAWENEFKYIYEYDSDDNQVFYMIQYWNFLTDEWLDITRTFYYYQIVTDVEELNNSTFNFEISPNPTSGYLKIEFQEVDLEEKVLRLFNAKGQLVLNRNISGIENNINIDVNHLAEGMYYFQLTDNNKQITKPLQIIR